MRPDFSYSNALKSPLLYVTVAAVLFYCAVAGKGAGIDYWYKVHDTRYYQELADAFLAGRLNLERELPPEVLANPYDYWAFIDPIQKGRVFDLSLYNGKAYLYFGAAPAVLFYVPFKMIFGRGLPDWASTTCLSFGAVAFAALLLLAVRRKYFPSVPAWMTATAIGTLQFGSVLSFLIRDSRVYEVAIVSGIFFFSGCMYFWGTWLMGDRLSWRKPAIGSFFLALATASRPTYALPTLALLPCVWWLYFRTRAPEARMAAMRAVLLPLAAVGLAVAIYNQARFGNPHDFGTAYQLTPTNQMRNNIPFEAERLYNNGHRFLFQRPIVHGALPFVRLNAHSPYFIPYPANSYIEEQQGTVGIFPGIPFLLLLFLSPCVFWAVGMEARPSLLKKLGTLGRALWQTALLYFAVWTLADPRSPLAGLGGSSWKSILRGFLECVPPLAAYLFTAFANVAAEVGAHLRSRSADSRPAFPRAVWGMLLLSEAVILGTLLFYVAPNLRYTPDFAWIAILLASITWFYFDGLLERELAAREILRTFALVSFIYTAYFWAAVSYFLK